MGITNDLFPKEFAFGMTEEQIERCDLRPDPEDAPDPLTRRRGIDNFEAFMRFLAPVARGPVDEIVRDGERVFTAIGCAACHVPALMTGPSANPMFHRKIVPLFSDLLLHDIGTGDGIQQGAARSDEMRTPALWGLRIAGRSCTMGAHSPSKTRSSGTCGKAIWPGVGSCSCPRAIDCT